jgi:inosose dehydratase
MKLAFSIPTRSVSEEEALFSSYASTGYDGLQLKSGQFVKYLNDAGDAETTARDDPGRFSGLIFGGPLDDDGQRELRRVVRFAAAVSSERVIFWHQHSREHVTDDDVRSFAEILSDTGRYALDRNVKLSLHHHYDQPVMFPGEIETFFTAATPGTVGLTLDTAHMWKSGEDDIAGVIRRFIDVLDNVHLKDCRDDAGDRRRPDGARAAASFMPLGKGEIDFDPIFAALCGTGYSSWLCVDEESGASVAESLQASRDFILEHLGKVTATVNDTKPGG